MNVNVDNFVEAADLLDANLDDAAFVAFDLEMTVSHERLMHTSACERACESDVSVCERACDSYAHVSVCERACESIRQRV